MKNWEKNGTVGNTNKQLEMRKIHIRRDPTSERMKSLKALVRIDNQIINMTVDTGSPISPGLDSSKTNP